MEQIQRPKSNHIHNDFFHAYLFHASFCLLVNIYNHNCPADECVNAARIQHKVV